MLSLLDFLKSPFPGNPAEGSLMAWGAAAGALLGWFLGGWDGALYALIFLSALDYVTGVWAAARQGALSSAVMYAGLKKKSAMFLLVGFGHLLDLVMQADILRDMAVCSFGAGEGLSVLENFSRLGYGRYIPAFFRQRLAALKKAKEVRK